MAIAALVEAFGVKLEAMTPVRTRAYDEGLRDIPAPLLNAAVRKAIATRQFFPKVAELRQDAESVRRELLAANQHDACDDCNYTGWAEVTIEGVRRVERCFCWRKWQQRLSTLGVTPEALALPPAREVSQVGEE